MLGFIYNPIYAWNLCWDLIEAGWAAERTSASYVSNQLSKGLKAGWLNKMNRQCARKIFVFADRVDPRSKR
jgi:hypothetical protein